MTAELAFDVRAFMADFCTAAAKRGKSVHGAAKEIGVNSASLSRYMHQGMCPKAAQLAAMSYWAHLNAADYVLHFGERLPRKGQA